MPRQTGLSSSVRPPWHCGVRGRWRGRQSAAIDGLPPDQMWEFAWVGWESWQVGGSGEISKRARCLLPLPGEGGGVGVVNDPFEMSPAKCSLQNVVTGKMSRAKCPLHLHQNVPSKCRGGGGAMDSRRGVKMPRQNVPWQNITSKGREMRGG